MCSELKRPRDAPDFFFSTANKKESYLIHHLGKYFPVVQFVARQMSRLALLKFGA